MAELLQQASDLAQELLALRSRDKHIGKVTRYLAGDHDEVYVPAKARLEYRQIAKNSITNWLPNVPSTFARALFVDGYQTVTGDNSPVWKIWQANGMDARQSVIIRGALNYGTSYAGVRFGNGPGAVPVMRPFRADRSYAIYEDDDDDWPLQFVYLSGQTLDRERLWHFYDGPLIYTVTEDNGRFAFSGQPELSGFDVPPVVRFRSRLGEESVGVVAPLIPIQNRVNEIVFNTQMALQYASFRQRWVTGMVLNFDPVTGEARAPFNSAVDQLWVGTSENTKFGELSQTDIRGHIELYNTTIKTLAALGYIAPDVLTGDLVNLSADALLLKKEQTQFELDMYKTNFGESFEQYLRLAAAAARDIAGAGDLESQVRWRDSSNRPVEQVVTALGLMVTELGVPQRATWPLIPGVTDGDLHSFDRLAEQAAEEAAAIAQAQPNVPTQDGAGNPQEGN